MQQIPCKTTGCSSKLLQVQGKWYRESQKKNPKPEAKKKQKLIIIHPFFISHLARWLRARRFSEPTFRPSGATNHSKNTVFRDFPTFSWTWIFSLLTLSSFFFSCLLWLFPSLLFMRPYCRKFDFKTCFDSTNIVPFDLCVPFIVRFQWRLPGA